MSRIGVFVCHCGINIAGTVDVEHAAEEIKKVPGVVFSDDYTYMCSTPGQELIVNTIREEELDGVVVASCSPRMHELTFRRAAAKAGLNPYLCEMANIREQCSWVHQNDRAAATDKAIQIIRTIVEKATGNSPLTSVRVPVTKRALVIGAGIAGIQAALDIADAGHEVVLVEKEPCLGGHMAQLSETFPTLDCASCIFTPKVVDVSQHERIRIYTYSEVEEVSGVIGSFDVKIRKKARFVDEEKCTGCGLCEEKCPMTVESGFDREMGNRKAIYRPFAQAVPNVPVIDEESCLYLRRGRCRMCERTCEVEAIDYEQQDRIVEEKVGAIVVATGYDLVSKEIYGEYGYGRYPDVIDGLQFERLLSASGPTKGQIRRPSDGQVPKEVVFIQCVGSRDDSKGISYCSRICCMYTAKQTMLYKHRVHDGQAYVFFMDVRAGGKQYEEFVKRAIVEEGAVYLRGRVSSIYEEDGKLIVLGDDTLSRRQVEIAADLVVLASAIRPRSDYADLAQKLRIQYDQNGFFTEAHVKLRPVETNTGGVFLAGTCQAPKDIPDTVAQASGAASKVLGLLSSDELSCDPMIASVDAEVCSNCGSCVSVCPYDARSLDERKRVATVEEALCQGCGACSIACPNGATQLSNFTQSQILAMVDELV